MKKQVMVSIDCCAKCPFHSHIFPGSHSWCGKLEIEWFSDEKPETNSHKIIREDCPLPDVE